MRQEIKRLLGVEILALIVVMASVISMKLYGADAATADVPTWLKQTMDLLVTLPYAGPVILTVLKYVGVIAAVMTGISTTVMVVATALKLNGQLLGFQTFAAVVDSAYKALWPYIAFLSVYNVPGRNK